jgi:hypothetical protein
LSAGFDFAGVPQNAAFFWSLAQIPELLCSSLLASLA